MAEKTNEEKLIEALNAVSNLYAPMNRLVKAMKDLTAALEKVAAAAPSDPQQ